MNTPKLSIVIATYNAAHTLERCLQSIIGQTFKDWELIIADGGSGDGTTAILRSHATHIAHWHTHRDLGIYDAWNQAICHARGEYVCFLGADDAWANQTTLANLFAAIGGQRPDVVTSRGLIHDPRTGKEVTFGSPWNYQRIGRRMVMCHPGLLHRRSLFERYGLFDTRYRIAGDLDFLLRLPSDLSSLHVDLTSVMIEASGISRKNVLARMREQRDVLARCERYGPIRAYVAWIDKLWRYPIARFLDIPH